ncbi:MAG TPA: dienelactone hydrolase family protein [Candidatus Binataceae bacterium]|nr:dienelactone hydrolase family protein [Candidatus Binataceae bacterium]
MSPQASRRRLSLGTFACAVLVLASILGPSSAFSAPSAAGDSDQPAAQGSAVAQASSDSQISPSSIEVHNGQFESAGKPVEDFYCVPPAPGAHPAVILLHGAVPRGYGNEEFAERCRKLAAAGYYAMFLEYYSGAGPARPGDLPVSGKGFAAWVNGNFPTWTREIADGINVLGQNPAVKRDRIALIGHSLGAFLALAVGASEGGRVAAIVEYYGAMNRSYVAMAANMPPTLILHGSADTTIPVRYAYDLDTLLTKYNRPHEMKIYPGAGHGLDPKTRADAWQRSLDFLRRYLGR